MIAKSFWLGSLRVMETPRVKTLGTTPGQDSCARWPKANFNSVVAFQKGTFFSDLLTPPPLVAMVRLAFRLPMVLGHFGILGRCPRLR